MSRRVNPGRLSGFGRRIWRATLLDAELYEEVEAEAGANGQALLIVVLAALAAGVGSIANSGVGGILFSTLGALVGWWVWAWVACQIGTRMLPGPETHADHGELLRTIGFSSAPGLLRIFAAIPAISGWVYLIGTLWMFVAMVVGIRQALDYSRGVSGTARAIAVCAIGFPIYAFFLAVTLLLLGPWPI